MSHGKIRTEKVCLNCGTETPGRYCPACGQENIEPKQSVWHLVTHFFSDITHFDGKFFVTVKDLFAKPGFLSREYMLGKRARYLDPVRMYIFTSAVFFLIFLSIVDVKRMHIGDEMIDIQKDPELKEQLSHAKSAGDSAGILHSYLLKENSLVKFDVDTTQKKPVVHTKLKEDYHSFSAYDSAQKSLPAAKRDGWLMRKYNLRKIEIGQRFEKDQRGLIRELWSNFFHNFPKVLFIILPVFALILKLLYIRRRQFYYVDHGIFSIHLYIFTFLLLLVVFGISALNSYTGWGWLNYVTVLLLLYPFLYYYKAMRRFYGQGRGKTLVKYFLLLFVSFFVQLVIFASYLIFTVFEI